METKFIVCTLAIALLLTNIGVLATSHAAWPFTSSDQNREIAEKEYGHSLVERYFATAFGDELPEMRDDLIKRKNNGENFLDRHFHAWINLNNWKVDPDNDKKEISN